MRIIFAVALIAFATVARASDDDAELRKILALFRCSQLAGIAEKVEEQKRLFALAVASGRGNGALERMLKQMRQSSNEIEHWYAERMSLDWLLGSIFASNAKDVDSDIRDKDDGGLPLPPEKRIYDTDMRRWKAERFYSKENCALLK
jgi:DNA-binding GntR family transcriptional regulator